MKFCLCRISLILTALVVSPTHAQITWQNVSGGSQPNTSSQMEAARSSMNSGFEQLKNVVSAQEDNERANWNARKNNNTQDYLDALYNYKTVKDLLANQDALERMRIGYGAQIDRNVARGAFDERLSTLMRLERN